MSRSSRVPATGIAPFSNDAPSAGWSTVRVGASMTRNGTVMNRWSVSSECLPVSGSERADVELVPAATQVDVGRPRPGRARGDEQGVLSGGRDRDRGARQRRALERVRRGDVVDVDDGRRRLGDRDRRRLGEAQDLDPEIGPERQDDDRQQGDDDDARREGQALARRGDRLRHHDGRRRLLASPRSCRHWSRTSSGSRPR